MYFMNLRCGHLVICILFYITTTRWIQLIAADAFKPMIAPQLSTTQTTIRPTTIGHQQKGAALSKPPQPQSMVGAYVDTQKDVPVAEALRREPISRYRNRSRRPFKRYHSQSYNRPRRRPKPIYGPPSYTFDPQPNDFHFDTEFYDPSPSSFPVKPSKSKPSNVVAFDPKDYGLPKDYGIVDTDIGKFYDTSSATFHVGPFKSTYDSSGPAAYFTGEGASSGAAAAGTAGGSGPGGASDDSVDFDDLNNYKYIGSSSALGGESEYKFNSPSAAAAAAADDGERYRYGSPSGGGADASPDYKFTSAGSAAAPYPPSSASFDASKYNLYTPQQQVVYQTAPKTLQSNRKLPPAPYPPAAKIPSRYSDNVLTKPLTASYSFGGTGEAANNQFNQPQSPNQYQKPPSTSYGVPIAPALNSYTYQSAGNSNNGYASSGQSTRQENFVSSISLTKSQEVGSGLPEGHFAEPPSLNEQELANVDDLYRKPQSSYDATPKARPAQATTPAPTPRRPHKVHSKRVTTPSPAPPPKKPSNSREEFEYDVIATDDDDDASSYVVRSKPMPQPALPNAYDQDDFHTVTKTKRKQPSRPSQPKPVDDFESYFDQSEIVRKPKKPKAQRTPAPQQIDEITETNYEASEDDYVDDLVRTPSPPVKKRKRPTKSSTQHNLDTDDLRAAFAADLANLQFSPFGSSKSRRNSNKNRQQQQQQKHQQRQQQQQQQSYDDDIYEDEEIVEIDSNERKSVVRKVPKHKSRSQQSSTQRIEQGTLQPPPAWDRPSYYFKQDGFQSRNDNFAYGNAPIFQAASPFQPSLGIYRRSSEFFGDPNSGERIASTLQTSIATTPKTSTTLYVWDGKTMPKNHKMA